MRSHLTLVLLAGLAVCAVTAASNASAAASEKEPTCAELKAERTTRSIDLTRLTASVEQKNLELGETASALRVAKAQPRKTELTRRSDGLRRELTVLLDREHESVDRIGTLDSMLAKKCGKRGGK